jgi:IS5 family transposase
VEPVIGHLKADHRMNRCYLAGSLGDALHTVLCAVGYNLRWLMRAVLRLGLTGFFALCVLAVSLVEFRQSRGADEVCRKMKI